MSAVGEKIQQFRVPVCNCFQAKNVNEQLCFEVDLNKFSNKDSNDKELDLGFKFIMDYNEDRQIDIDTETNMLNEQSQGLDLIEPDNSRHAFIYRVFAGNRQKRN